MDRRIFSTTEISGILEIEDVIVHRKFYDRKTGKFVPVCGVEGELTYWLEDVTCEDCLACWHACEVCLSHDNIGKVERLCGKCAKIAVSAGLCRGCGLTDAVRGAGSMCAECAGAYYPFATKRRLSILAAANDRDALAQRVLRRGDDGMSVLAMKKLVELAEQT